MRTCPSCRRFLQGDVANCSSCGATLSTAGGPNSEFDFDFGSSLGSAFGQTPSPNDFDWNSGLQTFGSPLSSSSYPGLPAPRWKRLVGFLLDGVLAALTLGIGWWIWFFIVAGRGQTPAKQLLKTRLAHSHNPSATWVIVVTRYMLIAIPAWLFGIVDFLGLVSLPYSMLILWNAIRVVFWLVPLLDALFIFLPRQQRLVDLLFKTQVVNS